MKRILVAMLCGALATTAMARTGVLKNGSFESFDPNTMIPTDWLAFGGRSSAGAFNDGARSCLADFANGSFQGAFQNTVSVGPGVRVLQRCLALHPSSDPLPGPLTNTPKPVAGIKLEFFPPEGLSSPPPEENLAFDANTPDLDTWVNIPINTVVPTDATIARIVLISFEPADANGDPINGNLNGPIYVDSVVLSLDGNATNPVANPSFESALAGTWNSFGALGSGAARNLFEVTAHNGSAVLKIGGPLTAGATQEVAVSEGQTFDLSTQWKSRSSGTPPTAGPYQAPSAFAGPKIEWVVGSVPAPNIDIAPNAQPVSATTNIMDGNAPTDTWMPLSIDYTMPAAKAALLRCTVINGFGNTGMGKAYYDNFEMVLTNVFDGSDADADGDEDMGDIAQLQKVFSTTELKYGGLVFDHAEDDDVDFDDVNFTLPRMTGPAAE
ncbi:MAG: hypothetical protein KDA32_03860 [Phycisphaerales bacterium]|nr:hypothetical protein [Phycisphaerales bacterium]